MQPLDSSFLRSAGYESGTLYITFWNGHAYTFHGAPESVTIGLITAPSPGEYYNIHIRGRY